VLERLGIAAALAPRLSVHPNGATAMRALAETGAPGALGCTQVTEILYTPGLALAGALPDPFGLATVYAAGIGPRCRRSEARRRVHRPARRRRRRGDATRRRLRGAGPRA
jgi:molybdate transport system substrate-binding protein